MNVSGRKTSDTMGRKRGGRPTKSDAEKRSVQQSTKLTLSESEYVKRVAQTMHLKPCDLTRRALLGLKLPRPVPEINHRAWEELRPLADDLRRILNRVGSGQEVIIEGDLIERFFEAVQSLRLELRGVKP